MTQKQKFLVLIAMLAKQTNEQVDEIRAEFYRERLEVYGYERVNAALADLLESARRFPTVAEIKARMGCTEASDEDKGREVAERIWAGISRFGSQHATTTHKHAEINAYIGPIGTEVVRQAGGWNQLCEIATYDNAPTLKAQWREMAAVVARKGRSGDLDTPPDFEKLPDRVKQMLVDAGIKPGDPH